MALDKHYANFISGRKNKRQRKQWKDRSQLNQERKSNKQNPLQKRIDNRDGLGTKKVIN